MCTPAIRALRHTLSGSHFTLLTSASGAAAAPYIAALDAAISYQAPWMKHEQPATAQALRECAARLATGVASEPFEAAVIFTSYSQSPLPAAMPCHLAGIPLRLASCRENPYQLLTHWVPEREPERATRHEVRRQLDLVAHVGCTTSATALSFAARPAAASRVTRMLQEAGIDPTRPTWCCMRAPAPPRAAIRSGTGRS